MAGRPTKLTPETQKKITEAIRLGATYKLACQYAGLAYNTFNEWMKAGDVATSGRFRDFNDAVKLAEGAAVVGWLAKIEKAASDGTWQAAAWKLERLHGDDYALTQKHRHGGDDDALPIRTEGTFTIQIDSRRGEHADDDLAGEPNL